MKKRKWEEKREEKKKGDTYLLNTLGKKKVRMKGKKRGEGHT